jgi:hypothetical protein
LRCSSGSILDLSLMMPPSFVAGHPAGQTLYNGRKKRAQPGRRVLAQVVPILDCCLRHNRNLAADVFNARRRPGRDSSFVLFESMSSVAY